ncbi:hypothetical protein CVT25_007627 [Psilocybe cyanescens]|uniref:Uncharacterized protein n=1 Tax=Psilocybe cyanescens TaxID=93625 RepID=A0A409XT81_PSICY|nr:hypothetical protein CVT25_007627 [Psilocybe cyanescens]
MQESHIHNIQANSHDMFEPVAEPVAAPDTVAAQEYGSIPEGFMQLIRPNNKIYVPKFLVSATRKEFIIVHQQDHLQLETQPGGNPNLLNPQSGNSTGRDFVILSDRVLVPADPLYMAEWEKLRASDQAQKAFKDFNDQTIDAIGKFDKELMALLDDS